MMTRLEQETYEVLMHSMPRIAEALERIAEALKTIGVKNGDNVSQARTD